MHPLGRYLVPLGIILLAIAFLWWALTPIIHYLAPLWPLLAIAIGIGILLWRFPLTQIRAAFDEISQIPIFRGVAIAFLFTLVYGVALWAGYSFGAQALVIEFGISQRQSLLIITILGLPAIPIVWRLYAATGIPGDPVVIGRGFRTLTILILIFFGWWYHQQPNQLFSHKNGEVKFWVAEKEGVIYFSEGYSLTTGEKLRPGKPEDAERFSRDSWLKDLQEKGEALFQPKSDLQPQAAVKYPNCPETRDKEARVGRKIAKTPLWLDCYSARIILPVPENGAGRVAFEISDQLHGVKFCNNEEWDRDRFIAAFSHDGWLNHLPCSSFRLRGKGEAKIFVY